MIKRGVFSKNVPKFQQNQLEYTMIKILRAPLESCIKFLYPKFYRIDDVETAVVGGDNKVGTLNETYNIIVKPLLLSLSKDNIDFDSLFLLFISSCLSCCTSAALSSALILLFE